ncbi:homocysteine S-methyltransferase [Alkaliphilus metalliredigens QYMF]|uniref:Methionine synthase n=1 Tax=Alkaliphilus metalliredigens (strain QYMF) TaxID=293826 RepID=A6TTI3_ALKMQ|nr:homocysteine S-methyltransferase family protein [Alkaliphilus metalliredigens]ABR49501.1 homocysteine S-methyltransferase [Alkaliphilus metalliredigens QYMF]
MNFLRDCKEGMLIFDGAMGTMLQKSGLKVGALPEIYNIEHPELIQQIHERFVRAGAQVVTTNTFQANELKLKDSIYSLEEIIEGGIKVAKASGAPYVALDIGPLGQMMKPLGEISFDRAYDIFKRQVQAGVKAGADCILIETISDLYEAKAAILAAKENSDLPVLCTMTFQEDGRTFTGTDPMTATLVLQSLGVDALGVNCSLGPKEMLPILSDILKYAKVPVMVQSNAGLPRLEGDDTIFPASPEEFALYGREMAELGVGILGGCCGTTPEHIQALKKAVFQINSPERKVERVTCACSPTKTVILDGRTTVIGERINPTGKKRLKEALRNNQLEVLVAEAIDQSNAGAQVLDVNVGLPEIDEVAVLKEVIMGIQEVVDTPLQIDSVNVEAMEAAARIYNGKPIINSVNGKEAVMAAVFPIAKKYGATLIGLTLDDKGIPETAEERIQIAKTIMERAKAYGIPKEDLIIDCLVMTASAQQSVVKETIKAVSLVKSELGLKTSLGVSNVSFGLPNRELLNRTFLATALAAGLDAPIMDPLSKEMMDTIEAFRVLNNEDQEAMAFIRRFKNNTKSIEAPVQSSKDLKTMIIEGRKTEVAAAVDLLLQNESPFEIIETYFIPALDQVGKEYEVGDLFLPQLLRAAETVKAGLAVIKASSFEKMPELDRGSILLATVKGDIHDIGKNIVKMLMENYGFQIIDLGRDVDPQLIVETIKKNNIRLVGLSALMTTTVKNMQLTIKMIKEEAPHCKVMVGGAVLNEEYAQMIGADYYTVDGQAGIRIAKAFFKGSLI